MMAAEAMRNFVVSTVAAVVVAVIVVLSLENLFQTTFLSLEIFKKCVDTAELAYQYENNYNYL